jgi:hypothetical protein
MPSASLIKFFDRKHLHQPAADVSITWRYDLELRDEDFDSAQFVVVFDNDNRVLRTFRASH